MSAPYYQDDAVTLHAGPALDVLRTLPDESVDCVVTSPPYYGLRSYGDDEQEQGREESPAEYVAGMVAVFREVRRVLAGDGTLWLNIGDSYARQGGAGRGGGSMLQGRKHGHAQESSNLRRRKPGITLPEKNLLGIPWRLAFALQDDGWILRNDIIWAKPNGMPESVTDRFTTTHEHVFLFSKAAHYWFNIVGLREINLDAERPQKRRAQERFDASGLTDRHLAAMRSVGMNDAGKATKTQSGAGKNAPEVQRLATEAKAALGGYYQEFLYDGGRNPGDVWTIPTQPFPEAHFAVMAPEVARRCVLAGCKPGGTVLDPYSGVGTTGMVAGQQGKRYVGIDLYPANHDLALRTRLAQAALIDGGEAV